MKTKCPDCCYPEVIDSGACGCCEGVEIVTPLPIANRPGLSKLAYRIGTHASFLETMMARLSSSDYPELAGLTTRDAEDPSIALLDGWATIADVLTFYQERIANEGYLRSATERRSILELARLVGCKLRPGVSSSVFLAYTIDENTKEETTIPAGSRVQSVPGPDELPQSFETSENLKARAKWNNLKPRLTQPQTQKSIQAGDGKNQHIYLKGISTNLKPNDPLLIDFFGNDNPEFFRVKEVAPDAAADRTLVILQKQATNDSTAQDHKEIDLIRDLTLKPSHQKANSLRLKRDLGSLFLGGGLNAKKAGIISDKMSGLMAGEASHATLKAFSPVLRKTFATAVQNAKITDENPIKVYALRAKASLFGHSHPGTPNYKMDESRMIKVVSYTPPTLASIWPPKWTSEDSIYIAIEPSDEQIAQGSWVVIERPNLENCEKIERDDWPESPELYDCDLKSWACTVRQVVEDARHITLSSFGVSSKVSLLTLKKPWLKELGDSLERKKACESLLRKTAVYARSEELELAEEPIEEALCGGKEQLIELDCLYEGLESGRWVIVSGERDIPGTSGVRFSELAMLATVTQNVGTQVKDPVNGFRLDVLPGDKPRTFIRLANRLSFCFKRDATTIYGNVVKATHGETRHEVMGSGDGSKPLQSFQLKQFPLTHVAASNPTGVDSTLKVIVNDMQWHETDTLADLKETDRHFITTTDNEDKTAITFGNGKKGARLPTGVENIKAEYRNGIGKPGNVKADQISLLVDKPLGVKEVINPLRASGGADRENRDQARKNAPLSVKALDRLVSVQDYEDFSRVYAGIGKAHAVEIPNGRRQIVHVTIAGADDIPIDETSDLFRNLRQALYDFGDPFQQIQLAVRELMMIVVSARVRLLPDYQWEPVVVRIREALLDAFGFAARELGQDVLLSEVISVMQAVRGVAYVDVDTFGGVPEKINDIGGRRLLTPDEISMFVDLLSTQWGDEDRQRLLTFDEISEYVKCSYTQWPVSVEEMEAFCDDLAELESENREIYLKYCACKTILKRKIETTIKVRQRLRVNLADFVEGVIRPTQLAFLTPDVPETLILNRIE